MNLFSYNSLEQFWLGVYHTISCGWQDNRQEKAGSANHIGEQITTQASGKCQWHTVSIDRHPDPLRIQSR